MKESEGTEDITTFPLYLLMYTLEDSRLCPTVSQYQLGAPVTKATGHLHLTQPPPNFGENSLIYSGYCPETKMWMCCGQMILSKIDEICALAIPKQISTISMQIPSLIKIHCYSLKLSSGNENTDVVRADNSVQN